MNVELRHLRALAAIGDEGTITGAAAVLRISQPALSRTLDQLERRVGTRLVERTTRSLALTAEGERLNERAHRILGELDDALAEAAGSTRPLRIGFAWAALGAHTVELLRSWRRDHPRTPVEAHHLADPYAALVRGSVDAVFLRALPERTAPDLAVLPLYSEPRVAAVSTDDPLAVRPEVSLRELAGRTVALCATAATTSGALWPAGGGPEATRTVSNVDEWLTSIATGEAVGLTAEATRHSHPHPAVRYLPLTDAGPVTVHFLAPAAAGHPATAAFRAHARAVLPATGTAPPVPGRRDVRA
ncbi:LysR family transcriptional regulator [Streptomyces bambusae]|uniref:LysR family transcriptional regulator n=1 Tax=Streptomyces bambusae TaxID=1550616 RepID=UPI001CFE3E14|nr:LysR family transcriptional regulator [Streptomyces bambusae]MCB5164733.1 LysR family transcriptional regulator [Streptomyces bambusae]